MKKTLAVVAAALAAFVLTRSASAFINPKFTPKDLMKQAEMALVLEIKSMDANSGIVIATVQKVLKADPNKPAPKEIKIDMLAMGEALSAQGKEVMSWVAMGEKQALMFSGVFDTGGGSEEGAVDEGASKGFLNLNGKWVIVSQGKDTWDMQKIWEFLLGTWAGSTDTLLKVINCIQADEAFTVPVAAGVEWEPSGIARIGNLKGKVFTAAGVDVAGKGAADLFVAADSGDKLFRFDGKKMEDITAKVALASKSECSAWGDFNGDGALDLASWDGKALQILSQKDGKFSAAPAGVELKEGCLSLAALDVGVAGKAGLLVGTKSWPALLTPSDKGFTAKPLGTGELPGVKELGTPGACLVADLDGDGLVDVLQVFAEGSLFYKGTKVGEFAAPAKCRVAAGTGRYGICLGDFDQDGLQDIFVGGDDRNCMFSNLGGGKFADMLDYCGSLAYISKSGGVVCGSGDFNNDGRVDLLVAYGTKMAPHLFFNRGFRCFGQARDIDLAEQKSMIEQVDKNLLTDASEPQQAACLVDLNGDNALDFVLVLSNGDVVFFPRRVTKEAPALAVVVSVPSSVSAGPVTVTAVKGDRSLGGWVIRAGSPGLIIGTETAGAVQVKITTPDGKSTEKKVKVRDAAVRVTAGKE